MIKTHYRWVIVAAGGLLGCVAIGSMFALSVLLLPISRDTGWSVTGISTAMTIGFLAMGLASMVWGGLSDRWGPRSVVLVGSVLLAASLALASQATSLAGFQILFGVGVGASTAAIFAPMMACVMGWFDTQRSLAVSLVSAGMGMAPMTMSPLVAWLVTTHIAADRCGYCPGHDDPAVAAAGTSATRRASNNVSQRFGSGINVVGTDGDLAAVHRAGADQLLLLRHSFRADFPHRELCRQLRHSFGRGGVDL